MVLVLAGLIFVQGYWINNAIEIKSDQFTQVVYRSLGNASEEIEKNEAARYVYDYISPHPYDDTLGHGVNFSFRFNSGTRIFGREDDRREEVRQEVYFDNSGDARWVQSKVEMTIKGDSIITFYSYNEDGKDDSVEITHSPEVIRLPDPDLVKRKVLSKKDLIDDVVSRMLKPDYPIEKRISPEFIESVLSQNFNEAGINIDFEYAVASARGDIILGSEGFSPGKSTGVYKTQLFPGDLFSPDNHLLVYFPEQRNLIYRSVGFMGITSLSLTSIIIVIFVLTLLIIFRQKKLSEMKNDFVNNMTHELKTPISTISLASQMLSDKSIPAENKNFDHISRIIDTESKRLSLQVEKVLQMAIFDRGKLKLKIREINLDDLIRNSISNFQIQVKKRGGMIEWKPGAGGSFVKVDEVHFGNVISNLLDNALKYSEGPPEIVVETYRRSDRVCVKVTDHGIGISKEEQKRVFEKFYRVPTGNVHNVKGFGLGLSYVKKIVDIHQGSINLKSEPGKGTSFEVCIPLETS